MYVQCAVQQNSQAKQVKRKPKSIRQVFNILDVTESCELFNKQCLCMHIFLLREK